LIWVLKEGATWRSLDLSGIAWQYNFAGDLTQVVNSRVSGPGQNQTTPTVTTDYALDSLERRRVATRQDGSAWRSLTIPAPAPDQISYDADGNLLSDGWRTYESDWKQRLLAVTTGFPAPHATRMHNHEEPAHQNAHFPCYDGNGNGNVLAMVTATAQTNITAAYDYDEIKINRK
jgi:hypothetical protein